ncbi:hypothetical protein [Amorphus orientalis]|uniref:Uncharacterized protein n=1 Tax=Amorphus orientalis TaxID=649198 RepID=A0AAE3VT30_9HYPH|nr:hypothetical protein [Amorphus orientalis]MDQ0317611.1 hypothetical protein [Amorphus orientalis]
MRMLREARVRAALIAALVSALPPCAVAEDAARSRPSLHAQVADGSDRAEPAWNPTPPEIRGPDRGYIEDEIKAAMNMTPPGRQVRLDLRSGSRLLLTVSAYEIGPGRTDCRTFHYRYQAFPAATAEVAGRRCWFETTGWRALRPDELLSSDGLAQPGYGRGTGGKDSGEAGNFLPDTGNPSPSSLVDGEDDESSTKGSSDDTAVDDAGEGSIEAGEDDNKRPGKPSRVILPFILDQTTTKSR